MITRRILESVMVTTEWNNVFKVKYYITESNNDNPDCKPRIVYGTEIEKCCQSNEDEVIVETRAVLDLGHDENTVLQFIDKIIKGTVLPDSISDIAYDYVAGLSS